LTYRFGNKVLDELLDHVDDEDWHVSAGELEDAIRDYARGALRISVALATTTRAINGYSYSY
jgi:hypothetical protein